MTKRSCLLGSVLLFALAAVPAHAGLILQFEGITGEASSLGSTAIAPGTSFLLEVAFPDTPAFWGQGFGLYGVDSIHVDVGGVAYTPTVVPLLNVVILVDPTYDVSARYGAGFGEWGAGGVLFPNYGTATPSSWSAVAATPVVFGDYLQAGNYSVSLDLSGTTLMLDFDPRVGVNTSILAMTEIPEPGAFVLYLTGLAAIAVIRRR